MSFRAWLSVFTLVVIAVIIYFSRHELYHAWMLLEKVNLWILALLIPVQLFAYFAGGEMIFSYLRAKKAIRDISGLGLARLALEMNFVNHVLPSGGVSGISYMTWRLGKYGVSPGRATMAQVVRFAAGWIAFIALLIVAVFIVTEDNGINRWIILVSSLLIGGMLTLIVGGMYLFNSAKRADRFAIRVARTVNMVVRKVTFGRKMILLRDDVVTTFFGEMHHDYIALRSDKKLLVKPVLWGLAFTVADVLLFWVTFWALGQPVNPAPILIAYGAATIAGFFVITPGGAGAYEAIMVAFLALAGLSQGTAIAGIVLTRVIILLGTIGLGYLFYQHAILKYGKPKQPTT
jgi:uncharacterized protein (TIRG00374 family)